MKLNIAFYMDSIPMNEESINLETSLGGSESALVTTANALAKRGHNVFVFPSRFEDEFTGGEYSGVNWRHADALVSGGFMMSNFDVFISQRQHHPFLHNSPFRTFVGNTKFNIIWHEDYILDQSVLTQALSFVDSNFFVSNWQRDNFAEGSLTYIRQNSFVTRNSIDFDLVNKCKDIEKNEFDVIYTSRPERGLESLVPIYIKLKELIPELTLKVCRYYSVYEPNPDMQQVLDYHDRLLQNIPDVVYLGNLNKEDLYEEVARSKLVLYPAAFDETSCINAIEAQALGTPMITTNRGGLMETLHDEAGRKIDGDSRSPEYVDEFILKTLELFYDEEAYNKCVATGKEHAKQYDADVIAEEWEEYLLKRFESRYEENKQKIYDNLVWRDDIIAAEYMSEKEEDITPKELPVKVLDGDDYFDHSISMEDDVGNARFEHAAQLAMKHTKKDSGKALDFACGNGVFVAYLCKVFPDYEITGIDFSEKLIEQDKEAFKEFDNVNFFSGSLEDIEGEFDFIFCGEFLEHTRDYEKVFKVFEDHLTDEGLVVFTVPTGPMREMRVPIEEPDVEGHVNEWSWETVTDVFGSKPNIRIGSFKSSDTYRGNTVGHFIICYSKGGEFGSINQEKKIKTTRPIQKLSVGMITKDCDQWMRLSLNSIKDIADEIIICDTGSSDKTIEIAKEYTNKIYEIGRWPEAPEEAPDPGSFGWAKNQLIEKASGDWLLNLDSDEVIVNPSLLRSYCRSGSFFNGFMVKQNHLMIDANNAFDTPVRLFKINKTKDFEDFKYCGILHEQPARASNINRSVFPSIMLLNSQIAHYGYLTEAERMKRATLRNNYLMELDRIYYPERELGHLLYVREAINKALEFKYTDPYGATKILKDAYLNWKNHFSDPNHRLYRVGIEEVHDRLVHALNIGKEFTVQVSGNVITKRFETRGEFTNFVDAWLSGFPNETWSEYEEYYLSIQDDIIN